ncbi:hypothetical protein [Kineococcus radiotolerans]|uniref:Uncharacterized protein n=1 Tax=Kineococcus radiotolerans (strain ATCC BAA-149 / DSM 14245 / SRS30216) TaxID=266940 RepID=A6WGD0_KINRD|nr:hypothetical protein [Kineococcus radiotolerans]ABS05869.1 hypothetical protein Krad_4410 [Kineococcus radiotolerans SRS30216 = ATCC BAA-149]
MSSKRRVKRAERRRAQVRAYVSQMRRCRCGKIHCQDREDAVRKHALALAWNGDHQEPVRYYACTFGGWHWTRELDDSRHRTPKPVATRPTRSATDLTPEQQAWIDELATQAAHALAA